MGASELEDAWGKGSKDAKKNSVAVTYAPPELSEPAITRTRLTLISKRSNPSTKLAKSSRSRQSSEKWGIGGDTLGDKRDKPEFADASGGLLDIKFRFHSHGLGIESRGGMKV